MQSMPLVCPLTSGLSPYLPLWAIPMRAAVHFHRAMRERRDAGKPRAIGVGGEWVLRDHRHDGGMARAPDAPHVQVRDLRIAVDLDGLAHLLHHGVVHLAVEEHAR